MNSTGLPVSGPLNSTRVVRREVVTLRFEADLGFPEIAKIQAASINTVQGRYRYGMEKLRALLDGEVET